MRTLRRSKHNKTEQTRALVLADLDGDGDLDLVSGNDSAIKDRAWFNDGTGRFTDGGQFRLDESSRGSRIVFGVGEMMSNSGRISALVGSHSSSRSVSRKGVSVMAVPCPAWPRAQAATGPVPDRGNPRCEQKRSPAGTSGGRT